MLFKSARVVFTSPSNALEFNIDPGRRRRRLETKESLPDKLPAEDGRWPVMELRHRHCSGQNTLRLRKSGRPRCRQRRSLIRLSGRVTAKPTSDCSYSCSVPVANCQVQTRGHLEQSPPSWPDRRPRVKGISGSRQSASVTRIRVRSIDPSKPSQSENPRRTP